MKYTDVAVERVLQSCTLKNVFSPRIHRSLLIATYKTNCFTPYKVSLHLAPIFNATNKLLRSWAKKWVGRKPVDEINPGALVAALGPSPG